MNKLQIAMILFGGVFLVIVFLVIFSKKSQPGPDPERRTRTCERRRRDRTAKQLDTIAELHANQSLNASQAINRMRALEVSSDTVNRVLCFTAQSHQPTKGNL